MPHFPRDPYVGTPYVGTPRGWRRKIGPKSKYGTKDNAPAYGYGIGPQGAQSSGNYRSSFTSQTRLGTPHAKTESGFSASMRESQEVSAANSKAAQMDKDRSAKAKATEQERREQGVNRKAPPFAGAEGSRPPTSSTTSRLSGMLDAARRAGRNPVPVRPGPRTEGKTPNVAHSSPAKPASSPTSAPKSAPASSPPKVEAPKVAAKPSKPKTSSPNSAIARAKARTISRVGTEFDRQPALTIAKRAGRGIKAAGQAVGSAAKSAGSWFHKTYLSDEANYRR